jgi:plasmid stabilization system protein ParE
MTIRFTLIAELEFRDAIDHYNLESSGLGYDFADEVQNTLARILSNPTAWTPLSTRSRRCLTKRFPFGIIYQIKDDTVLISAVMHMHRDPVSWKKRI